MAKTRGRPRKFSGPLQKGKTSIRGLNKTEKKQVESKIETAIKKNSTLKFFNSSNLGETAQHPQPTIQVGTGMVKQVSVIGYSSNTNENSAGTVQKYGGQSIVPLLLSSPFKADETDEKLVANHLNGYYAIPKVARTMFSIERVAYEVDVRALTTPTDDNMARSLPIM